MLTGKERMSCIMQRKKADRIGLYEHFWGDTANDWLNKGKLEDCQSLDDIFGFDLLSSWPFNFTADLDFVPERLTEDEDTYTTLDGNGATLRRHKKHDTTPEHISFSVTESRDYYEKIQPLIVPSDRRINYKTYSSAKSWAAEKQRFFVWSGVNVFELMHPVCGHENMLVGMALEPEWIAEMAMDFAKATVAMQEMLFAKEGKPDGIWYYEDMGFKERPFMSPDMYKELIQPAHKYTIDFAKSMNLPVIMHSCGFVEPLLPGMIEAGIDCLQVIEVKAGMDLLRIYKNYGDRLSLMGGIDVRALYSNDKKIIDAELESKIPIVKQGFGYTLHSDHSIPNTVEFESYKYFVEKGLELGKL
jgi:uroporphyrinogen decarboxylase